jgi:hypothetical protein
MQPFKFAVITSGILYTILYDAKFFYLFLAVYGFIVSFNYLTPNLYNGLRKKITIATWTGNHFLLHFNHKEPQEGSVIGRYDINTTKVDEFAALVK